MPHCMDNSQQWQMFSDYITEDGIVTIGDNEVIYLFELGTNSPASNSADFQDLPYW